MTVWVLFVWMGVGLGPDVQAPHPMLGFSTQKECQEHAAPYKKAACIKVEVPK